MQLHYVSDGGEGEDSVGDDEGGNEQEVHVLHEYGVVHDVPHAVDEHRAVDVGSPVEVGDHCDH